MPEPEAQPQVQAAQPTERPAEVDRGVVVEPKRGWSPIVFFVGAGLTAVAGAATIWSGIDTLNNPGKDVVRDKCSDTTCPEYQEGLNHQRRTNILIGVTAGLGLGTAIIGALLTDWSGSSGQDEAGGDEVIRGPSSRKSAGLHVDPWISVGSGATLGATGTF
jgi:hypothetical protein